MVNNAWKTITLSEIGAFQKGSGISRAESNSGALPAVRYGELYTVHNNYVRKYTSHISHEVASKALRVHCGDILFACSGETKEDIAKCAAIIDDSEVYAGGDIIVLSPEMKVDPVFLGFILNTQNVIQQRAQKAQGDAIVHISTDSIKSIEITMPEYSEQVKIAEALYDIDTLIVNLEKLIAKKKAIKQGAMQELLTGKRRLPGFDGEWITVTVGEICNTASGGTPSRQNEKYYSGNISWFTTSELTDGWLTDSLEHISNDAVENSAAKIYAANTILLAMYGATIGKLGILKKPAASNQACCALMCKKDDFLFLFYKLMSMRTELISLGCGAGQPNISQEIVKRLSISLPESIDEQKAISEILRHMDEEITSMTCQLKKYQGIRDGMMSELLTGRIRL